METIVDTMELDEDDDYEVDGSDLSATDAPTTEGMEFHVQMKSYTLRDFDDMVVEAAARVMLGRHGDRDIAKQIEAKCIDLLNQRISATLEPITTDIIDQPLLPKSVFPGSKEKEPVTMREFVGLCGREFLAQKVGHDGKPKTDNYGSSLRLVDRHRS